MRDPELGVGLDAGAEEHGAHGLRRLGGSFVHGRGVLGDVPAALGRALGQLTVLDGAAVGMVVGHADDVDVALANVLADGESAGRDHAILVHLHGVGLGLDGLDGLDEGSGAHVESPDWLNVRGIRKWWKTKESDIGSLSWAGMADQHSAIRSLSLSPEMRS